MRATVLDTTGLVKTIDKQLKAILARDIRKIGNADVRNAAFLQLIAA
jgi:hypothetical protein